MPTPKGPGSVSGAPNLPAGFTVTCTSRFIHVGGLRQHAIILDTTIAQNEQRKARRLTLPVLETGGEYSSGEGGGRTMKLAADDVQSLVIPAPATGSPSRLPKRCWRR